MPISLKEKRFICTFPNCSMQFDRSEHLTRHERKHTGEKPFVCIHSTCTKRFSRYDNMLQHKKTHEKKKGHRRHRNASCTASDGPITPPPFYTPSVNYRRLAVKDLCNPLDQEVIVSGRSITLNEYKAIGVLLLMSREGQ